MARVKGEVKGGRGEQFELLLVLLMTWLGSIRLGLALNSLVQNLRTLPTLCYVFWCYGCS